MVTPLRALCRTQLVVHYKTRSTLSAAAIPFDVEVLVVVLGGLTPV